MEQRLERNMIAVVDSGLGNVHSIVKALEYVGGEVMVATTAQQLAEASKIVLPGVGAFGDGMQSLKERGFASELMRLVKDRKIPFLGICLGMQLITNRSFEFGTWEGLGFVDAEVKRFTVDADYGLKVPHTGWNTVSFTTDHPVFKGLPKNADFYFVHSYYVIPNSEKIVAATTDYGRPFVSAIATENIVAVQFHPEKSQRDGLQLLENFINWQP